MISLTYGGIYKTNKGYTFVPIFEDVDNYVGVLNAFSVTMSNVRLNKTTGYIFDSLNLCWGAYQPEIMQEQLELTPQIICNCGGLKTYNSMHKEFHSWWCEVNRYG